MEDLVKDFPDLRHLGVITLRLIIAMALGSIIGAQREHIGKPAGLRTHMLISLGAALFIMTSIEFGMDMAGTSRVLQGLVTGIGFLGAGAILKVQETRQIEGLTTAAGMWMTAAIGVAVGLGRLGLALVSAVLAWLTLSFIGKIERRIIRRESANEPRLDNDRDQR